MRITCKKKFVLNKREIGKIVDGMFNCYRLSLFYDDLDG